MHFNIAKCKVMYVGNKRQWSMHPYTMMDENGYRQRISVTTLERDLGALVSADLNLSSQYRAAAAAANWKFGVLRKSFSSRSQVL